MFSQDFKERHRLSPTAFTRCRKLSFPILVLFLANFLKGSLQDELDQFFQAFFRWDVAKRWVTRSAVSQARRKLSHRAFIELLDTTCRFVDQHAPLVTYQNHRVFAIDGSTFRVPNRAEFEQEFGQIRQAHHRCILPRFSILHDVLNRLTYDAILDHNKTSEGNAAFRHLEETELPAKSIILLDRGYCHFTLLKSIKTLGHQYCVRVSSERNIYKSFVKSGKRDMVMVLPVPKEVARKASSGSLFSKPMMVRMIRFHIKGEMFILMTSLIEKQKYSRQDLIELYHQRWQIEESFKSKKARLKIEEISGLDPDAARQDFHAKIFAEALTSALLLQEQEHVDAYNDRTLNHYKLCLTQALAKMKNTIALLFLRNKPRPILKELSEIFRKSLTGSAPGRTAKRRASGRYIVKIQIFAPGYKSNR
ncbi:IS4 family transposase [Acanthopleuribacter pedis]